MATVQYWMSYTIFFTDQSEYDFAIAFTGGSGTMQTAPTNAAAVLGIPYPFPTGDMSTIAKGIYFMAPFTPGAEFKYPNSTGIFVNEAQNAFLIPGQTIAGSTGPDGRFDWVGNIVYQPAGQVQDPIDYTPIPPRRWVVGFEQLSAQEGGTFSGGGSVAQRVSSRTTEGQGFGIRGQNTPNSKLTKTVAEYGHAPTRSSWERFYVRFKNPGAVNITFWHYQNSAAINSGGGLRYNTDGSVSIINIDSGSVETVLGSFIPDPNKWYRFDTLVNFPSVGTNPGRFRGYVNGVYYWDFQQTGSGIGTVGFHSQSEIGKITTTADNSIEIDLDDWICADIPNRLGAESLDSVDWYLGSHVKKQFIESGTSVGYTGSIQAANQGVDPNTIATTSTLTSTTSGALVDGVTNVTQVPNEPVLVIGPVAGVIGLNSTAALGTDGQLGYSIAGGAPVMTTVNELTTQNSTSVLVDGTGGQFPIYPFTPFNVRYTKSVDANSRTIFALQASLEYIGVWGREDNPDCPDFSNNILLHNNRLANTPFAYLGPRPDGSVYAYGLTYVGTGPNSSQDITLPAPPHFMWIRALTGGLNGVKYFASSVNGHLGITDRIVPNYPLKIWYDEITGLTKMRVVGNNAEINNTGIVYQIVGFCDPCMRFNITGAYNTSATGYPSKTRALPDPNFTPQFGFIQNEVTSSSSSAGLSCKGPAHSGDTANFLNGTAIVSWGAFALGAITTKADVHYSTGAQTNYSLWRSADGPNCGFVMVQITSYVGDGTASRVIPLTPTSLRYPLFALVQPHNAVAYFRDPSHTGSNSARADTLGNSTTAITAGGLDTLTVGITLNAVGIVYEVFVICGDPLGWNNGTFGPPDCIPGDEWSIPTYEPPDVGILSDGGLQLNGTVPLTLLKNVSGIYTLVPGKRNDTLYDRQTGQTSVDVKIPNPTAKTGYIGG